MDGDGRIDQTNRRVRTRKYENTLIVINGSDERDGDTFTFKRRLNNGAGISLCRGFPEGGQRGQSILSSIIFIYDINAISIRGEFSFFTDIGTKNISPLL